MNFSSFYARLRLTAVATQSEIKSAYYRLSKIYHPDKNNDCPKAAIQFRNISEAYVVLSDPKSRTAYDKEHFPNTHWRGASARFRSSYRRRRIQEHLDSAHFEDLDSIIDERIKKYRNHVENITKQ